MRVSIRTLQRRIAKLLPPSGSDAVSLFDLVAGAVPPHPALVIDARHLDLMAAMEATVQDLDCDRDRIEDELQACLADPDYRPTNRWSEQHLMQLHQEASLPYGLKEMSPDNREGQ